MLRRIEPLPPQLSSPAKAGDPVFRGVSDRAEGPRRTGYSAFAEYEELLRSCIRCAAPLGIKSPDTPPAPACYWPVLRWCPAWSQCRFPTHRHVEPATARG